MEVLVGILNVLPGDGGAGVATYCLNHVVYLLPWFAPIGWC
jgi:hypothetical protein